MSTDDNILSCIEELEKMLEENAKLAEKVICETEQRIIDSIGRMMSSVEDAQEILVEDRATPSLEKKVPVDFNCSSFMRLALEHSRLAIPEINGAIMCVRMLIKDSINSLQRDSKHIHPQRLSTIQGMLYTISVAQKDYHQRMMSSKRPRAL